MVKRLAWLTGIAGILLALARAGRLLDVSDTSPSWQESLAVAAVLGIVMTLLVQSARAPQWTIWLLNAMGALVLAMRLIDSSSMSLGLLPTADTFSSIAEQMEIALQLIRFGAAPVVAVRGVVALLAVLFWAIGALVAFGARSGRVGLAVTPPLIVYLQFATFDRRPPGPMWIALFLTLASLALVTTAPFTQDRLGRARFTDGRLVPRRSPSLLATLVTVGLVGALFAGNALAATVPESGFLGWRTNSGVGSGLYGSGSANVFVGLQQQLVDLSDEPVFYARLSDNAPPNRELYWKLITLDRYDGEFWRASDQTFATGGRQRWERDDWKFAGPRTRVSARVQIAALRGSFLPTVYSPVDLSSDEELIAESFRVREDGSVAIDLQVIDDWTYQFQADVPGPDIGALATVDGGLSPVFQAAADAGEIDLSPSLTEPEARPDSIETYVELPEDVRDEVSEIAELVTANAATPFEEALLLESFFRDPDEFRYSTEVNTGHTSLDLVDWITDPESVNYRTGYCEQFATAMGVLGRALGIPSRIVVGYTPGEIQTQEDGSELVVVRERNSHAWVEMWMDGQGWVRFDPTPRADGVNPALGGNELGFDARQFLPAPDESQGSGANPSGESVLPDRLADRGAEGVPEFGEGQAGLGVSNVAPWWLAGLAVIGLMLVAIPTFKWMRRRRRITRILTGDVDAAWREIVDRLTDLGEPLSPSDTPLEIAGRSGQHLVPLAHRYGEAAYGGRVEVACADEFTTAEDQLRTEYERFSWWRSWLSPRSLWRR